MNAPSNVRSRRAALPLLAALAACAPRSELSALPPEAAPRPEAAPAAFAYPAARRCDQVDDYHGTRVADPYRWLEEPDAPETRRWIEAENRLFESWISAVPERDAIHARLTELWNYERTEIPVKRGERYFFRRNDGLQNQSVLYVADELDGEPRVLIDPNALSADGTVALSAWSVSEDGLWVAYGVADGGSDWTSWRVRDVDSGKDLDERLEWIKFSGAAWTLDGEGFFYARYPAPASPLEAVNRDQAVYYHRLRTPQSADVLVYARPDEPEWSFEPIVTEDGSLLVLDVGHGTDPRNRVYYRPLGAEGADAPFVRLLDAFDADYELVGKLGNELLFQTDLGAARRRVVAIDLGAPERERWREVVPESRSTLERTTLVGGRVVCRYLSDARSEVRLFEPDGRAAGAVELPGLGTAAGFDGRADDPETFFSFSSTTTPTAIWRCDARTAQRELFRAPKVGFDSRAYATRQVFCTSQDGTRVPMFLTYRADREPDARTPCLLYGYGGFNVPLTPTFSVERAVWLEMGGLFAVANLRGGGEYGREWHEAGTKERKQNVFDDFVAAAEWLVAEGLTSKERLAIQGGSNGGLLVGACLTQRPELFGAAIPEVGVLDMLRYHDFTIGWAWASDYGTSDDPEAFRYLVAYSPVHNARRADYPPTLITTGDHDDRVVPMHSFKFAAALQHAQAGRAPILTRIETRAGHGAGKPTSMAIDASADELAFLVRALAIDLSGKPDFAPRPR